MKFTAEEVEALRTRFQDLSGALNELFDEIASRAVVLSKELDEGDESAAAALAAIEPLRHVHRAAGG